MLLTVLKEHIVYREKESKYHCIHLKNMSRMGANPPKNWGLIGQKIGPDEISTWEKDDAN